MYKMKKGRHRVQFDYGSGATRKVRELAEREGREGKKKKKGKKEGRKEGITERTKEEKEGRKEKKRRPRASNGQRYPLPYRTHVGNLKCARQGIGYC